MGPGSTRQQNAEALAQGGTLPGWESDAARLANRGLSGGAVAATPGQVTPNSGVGMPVPPPPQQGVNWQDPALQRLGIGLPVPGLDYQTGGSPEPWLNRLMSPVDRLPEWIPYTRVQAEAVEE